MLHHLSLLTLLLEKLTHVTVEPQSDTKKCNVICVTNNPGKYDVTSIPAFGILEISIPFSSILSYSILLYCIVLYCIVLYCIVFLFCSVLFCSVLFCSVLFCSVLFCSVLFCSVLICFVLFCFLCYSIVLLFFDACNTAIPILLMILFMKTTTL